MANNGFEELMQAWFLAGNYNERKAEGDIQGIAHVLERAPNISWSRIPRIYSVLRIIDQLDAIDCFLAEGVSDVGFPFSSKSLPSSLRDNATRSAFLTAQELVFNTKAQDLEREQTRHSHFRDPADIPLKKIEELGKGAYGFVDRVVSTISHKEYARKLIPRGKTFKKDKEVLRIFERELGNLKKISTHKHIVQLVASYTEPRYVGILTSPVADCNLHEYLKQQLDSGKRSFLRSFFGCLTSAVCFLHDNQVRHKDIKPQNVLVKGDCVFLTDFGLALDWSERNHSVTTGPSFSTPRYGAPEVVNNAPRSSPADIWSLGCVFLEIWTLLRGESKQSLELHLENTGSRSPSYCLNSAGVGTWIESIVRRPGSAADDAPVVWIKNMLHRDGAARWTAHELEEKIQTHDEDPTTPFAFTGRCCTHDEDTAESVYSTCDEDVEDTIEPPKAPASKPHSKEERKAEKERVTTGCTWDLPVAPPDDVPALQPSHSPTCSPDSSLQQHNMFEMNRNSTPTPPIIDTIPDVSDRPQVSAQIPKEKLTQKSIDHCSPFQPYVEDESVSLARETDDVPCTQAEVHDETLAKEVKMHSPPPPLGNDAATESEVRFASNNDKELPTSPPGSPLESISVPPPAEDDGWGDDWGPAPIWKKKKKSKNRPATEPAPAEGTLPGLQPETVVGSDRDDWGWGSIATSKSKKEKMGSAGIPKDSLLEQHSKPLNAVEDDPWDSFRTTKVKKKKKGTIEEILERPPKLEPAIGPGPEPILESIPAVSAVDPFAHLSKSQNEQLEDESKKEAELKRRAEVRAETQRTEQTGRTKMERSRPRTVHSGGNQWVFFSSGTKSKYACKDCSKGRADVNLSCGHIVCRECMTSKLTLSVQNPQHMPPKCGDTEIAFSAERFAVYLGPEIAAKWVRKYLEYKSVTPGICKPTADNVLFCPRETCKEWIIPFKIRVDRQSGKKFVRCAHCFTPVCLNCGLKFHADGYCTRLASRPRKWEMCWQICPKCTIPWNTCKCGAFREGVHDTQNDHDVLSITSEERYDPTKPKEKTTEIPSYPSPEPSIPSPGADRVYYHYDGPPLRGQHPQPSYSSDPYRQQFLQNPFEESNSSGYAPHHDNYPHRDDYPHQPWYRAPPPPPDYYDIPTPQPNRPSGRHANDRSRNPRTNTNSQPREYEYTDPYTGYDQERDISPGPRPLLRRHNSQRRTHNNARHDDESHASNADSSVSAVVVVNQERESALAGLSYDDALNSPERILEWLLHVRNDHDATQKTTCTNVRSEYGDEGYTDSSETFIESEDEYWDPVET